MRHSKSISTCTELFILNEPVMERYCYCNISSNAQKKKSQTKQANISWYEYSPISSFCCYLRVTQEEQAEDRVGSEEVNEGAAQAPACQR